MVKSRYLKILFILCLVVSVFCSYKYFKANESSKELQESINNQFTLQLGLVINSLSVEVSEESYRSILSSVSSAASLSKLTTYDDMNDDLDLALDYLYLSLRKEDSKDITLSKIDELREIFYLLIEEPTSKEATDQLLEIVEETYVNDSN